MSEIRTVEDVHRFLAESDRANPPPCPVEVRQRELAAERERQACVYPPLTALRMHWGISPSVFITDVAD